MQDIQAALALKKWTGGLLFWFLPDRGRRALGMAIAMNGMDKCITVAMVGKVLDDDEILKSIETERRHLGLSPKRQTSVIPVIMRGIMG